MGYDKRVGISIIRGKVEALKKYFNTKNKSVAFRRLLMEMLVNEEFLRIIKKGSIVTKYEEVVVRLDNKDVQALKKLGLVNHKSMSSLVREYMDFLQITEKE